MLASTTKYGIRALLYLAKLPGGEFIQVKELSERSDVPGPYLAKIMKTLAQKGVVITRKGAHGGVRIPERETPLSFYEVCVALDDPIAESQCMLSKKECGKGRPCAYHERWKAARAGSINFLESMKIAGDD